MKNDGLYNFYLNYLKNKLLDNRISNGEFKLLIISESYFTDFKYRFEHDKQFSKIFSRDKKIDEILDDEVN